MGVKKKGVFGENGCQKKGFLVKMGVKKKGLFKQTIEADRLKHVKAKFLWEFRSAMKGMGFEAFKVRLSDTLKKAEESRIAAAVAAARPQGLLGLFV